MTETHEEPLKEELPLQEIGERKPFLFQGVPIGFGRHLTPLKIVIYGANGVGKSCFAASAKNPVFLDLEENIDHLAVAKQSLGAIAAVESFLHCLLSQPHEFKTVVVDSLDKLEQLTWHALRTGEKRNDLNYGKGYVLAADMFRTTLSLLDDLRLQKGMNVILIGHETIRRCENPLSEVYDRIELRLHEKLASLVCDWAHCILYAARRITFEAREDLGFNQKRARVRDDDERVLYTRGNTAYVAKNVFDLPETMPLDWPLFIAAVRNFYQPSQSTGEQIHG